MTSVIRALSGLTPGGNNRDIQANFLAIGVSEENIPRGETVMANPGDNPRRRPSNEFNWDAEEKLHRAELGRNLMDIQPTLENRRRSRHGLEEEDLTSVELSQVDDDGGNPRRNATEPL